MKAHLILLLSLWAGLVAAQPVGWQPLVPTKNETLEVTVEAFTPGDMLHWAVVIDHEGWVRPLPAYHPKGSVLYGSAVRTPFEEGVAPATGVVELGPFNDTNQVVGAVVFSVLRADGTWDNNRGDDYVIPIGQGRITFSPEEPTAADIIEVTVHNSRRGGYLRWGANAKRERWTPLHPAYWPEGSEMSDDEVGLDTPLPDPDAEGRSVLWLGPFNQGQQMVRSLHMAVRWGREWDTDGGRNYNLAIRWQEEDDPAGVRFCETTTRDVDGEEFRVAVEAPAAKRVELWLNGEKLDVLAGPPFEREVDVLELPHGPHTLVARTLHAGEVKLDEMTFWRVPATRKKNAPEGVGFGATEQDGEVTFALYAPGKRYVSLVGDFNGWDSEADRMHPSSNGIWWITRELHPGTYRYQYDIEGDIRLADPYARQVDWTHEIHVKGWLPTNAFSILQVGADPFEWSEHDYQRPALEELVIYELYIEDFVPGQGFSGMIDKLDYIQDLGFNAIEPLPWHPWPGVESWGYNPAFHFAVEQLYGTPEDLKRLIDEAHRRGMAVIIDMVLNHADWNSPIYQLYDRDYDASPYFREYHGHNWGFPKIDQQSPAVQQYVADVIRFWIEEYRVDGFRYDATRWTDWKGYNDWGASWFAYVARQADPASIQIAEHLPIEPPLITDTEMNTTWHAEYRWNMRNMLMHGQLDPNVLAENLDARRVGFDSSFQRIPYTESHDEERVVRELREAGYDEAEVFRRACSALVLTLTTPGVPMVYAGQEFGEDTLKNVGWNPLQWELLDRDLNSELLRQTRALVHMRAGHPALRQEQTVIHQADTQTGLAVYERGIDKERVWVAINFGRQPVDLTLELCEDVLWDDILDEAPQAGGTQHIALKPGEAKVWATAH